MFKTIKKRVKNLSDSVHGRSNKTGGHHSDDGEKLNTPARQYTGMPPLVPNSATSLSPSGNIVSATASDTSGIAAQKQKQQQQQQKQQSKYQSQLGRPPTATSTSYSRLYGRKSKNILDIPLEDLDVVSKIEHLAAFDICVQASDALAAASGLSDHRQAKQADSVMNEERIDPATGLPCTSVLVSPDGNMLLIPPVNDSKDVLSRSALLQNWKGRYFYSDSNIERNSESKLSEKSEDEDRGETNVDTEEVDQHATVDHAAVNQVEDANKEEDISTVGDDSREENAIFSGLRLHGKDDYESSVYVGHDLHPAGDKALNGFSARGWSIPATSLALEQTEQSLNAFAHFCEQMVLSRKESSARTAIACDNLRRAAATIQQGKTSADSWVIIDPRAGDFEMTSRRTGPLLAENSTLAKALAAVEEYYTAESEKEAHKWRTASLQRDMVLPTIHEAVDQLHERSLKRQLALQENSRRASLLEERIRALQQLAQAKWEDVYEAEERVTTRQQQLMEERRQQKEKARLEKLQKDEVIRLQETASANKGEASLGATSQEIWDMVSAVVDPDNPGSFEPMDLPTAPLSAPRDRSALTTVLSDDVSVNSIDTTNTESTIPIATRDEIAAEIGLPQLRAVAMQADEAVRDHADTLLNVLSTLDTTRRSARIAAETCLLGAANAQAASLQAWIQLEKEALTERLNGLTELEMKVKSTFNVRADLDTYITADKRERGGSSHLGDDDDGGIASALAVLSSHVDGMERDDCESYHSYSQQSNNINGEDDDASIQSQMNDAIDKIFQDNGALRVDDDNKTKADLEASVDALCKIAAGKSRARRSAICYALNAKRSGHAKMNSVIQFEALSKLFYAILIGCNSEVEVGGVANAKMCMMLAQTFYIESNISGDSADGGSKVLSESSERGKSRIYAKSRLMNHPIWSKDDYWDIALSQQISESLTQSGVMSNFERTNTQIRRKSESEHTQSRKTRWYDLNQTERIEAASQVHAVVFAQLGALAHSMIELGCGLERACAFVRRMSIRNQLPSSHRTMLLVHLLDREHVDRKESVQ